MKEFKIFNKKVLIVDDKEKRGKSGRPKKRSPELISKVFDLNNQGLSLREIEKELKISYSTVRRILKNEVE